MSGMYDSRNAESMGTPVSGTFSRKEKRMPRTIDQTELKNNLLFRGMTDEERAQCLALLSAAEREYEKGEVIFSAGSTTRYMGIVLSGSVTVEMTDLLGGCTILSKVGKGGIFAETFALLSDTVMPVDAVASEDSRILFLCASALRQGFVPRDAASLKLLSNLLQISLHKNLLLSSRSFHTAPKSIRGKVLAYLNSVSLQKHADAFEIPFDRQQLADYLNVDRTALSKELGKMQKDGIIRFHRSRFELSEPAPRLS